jgi:hypothetical protein
VEEWIGRNRVKRRVVVWGPLVAAALLAAPGPVQGQGEGNGVDRVRVFLDCQTRGCPQTEFRTEITFVDWVRERTLADLHVIVTAQQSGAGTAYVFDLVGQEEFAGESSSVTADVSATATQAERFNTLTRTFKAALVPYVIRRGYADRLEINAVAGEAEARQRVDPAQDPWNLWVMRVGVRGEASGEEQQSEYQLGGNISAWRVTEDWKIDLNLDGTHTEEEFELSDGLRVFTTDEWELDALIVKSLSPHWSAGTELGVERSTRLNREVGGRAALAVEWNLFPYVEANRRQLLFHYQLGYSHVRYEEETIFDKTREDLFDHRAALLWESRQPWGDGSLGVFYSNYLHDWTKFRLSMGGEISVRLVRGLDLDIEGSYDLIRDQIYLSAAELDDEDILVQQRQLATGYEYDIEIGLSYRFGSIFNNVVNNRFPWMVRRF